MANTDLTYGWASITKSHEMPDGSVIVEGRLGGPTEDLDGQYLDKDWLDVAVPKWAQRGNIRAMHQPISAGTAQKVTDTGDDWHLVAKINDPVEVRKVLDGNYTGFSVGVKNGKVIATAKTAKNGRALEGINGGDIVEVSLADFPCDPINFLNLFDKAVSIDDKELEELAKTAEPVVEPVVTESSAAANMTLAQLVAKMATGSLEGDDLEALTAIKAVIDQALDVNKGAKGTGPATLPSTGPSVQGDIGTDGTDATGEPTTLKAKPRDQVTAKSGNDGDDNPKSVSAPTVAPSVGEGKKGKKNKSVLADDLDTNDLTKTVTAAVVKAVTGDLLKAALSEALKPLEDRIASVEKMAAPGGPHMGSMRQLSGPVSHQKALLQKRADALQAMLDHPDANVANGARDQLNKLAAAS